ncbi:MAG: malate synthase A [Vibrionaceae bacterium]
MTVLLMEEKQKVAISFTKELTAKEREVFTSDTCSFLHFVCSHFVDKLPALLAARRRRQAQLDSGEPLNFLEKTSYIRQSNWKINHIPQELCDRRAEHIGPVDPVSLIQGLNSPVAKVFVADFENNFLPTWENLLQAQRNLTKAIYRTLAFIDPKTGKPCQINPDPATLICRVRCLEREQPQVLFEGKAVPAALLDFALYFSRNYKMLQLQNAVPYFCLTKLHSYQEAAWWASIFRATEDLFGLARGSIKVTVMIETLPALFEMNEILFYLKEHAVALNFSWLSYLASSIKMLSHSSSQTFCDDPQQFVADPLFKNYSELVVKTCHRRGVLALSTLPTCLLFRNTTKDHQIAQSRKAARLSEIELGFDGGVVTLEEEAKWLLDNFKAKHGDKCHQLDRRHEPEQSVTAKALQSWCFGQCSEQGFTKQVRIALQCAAAWLDSKWYVMVDGQLEDQGSAELACILLWHWLSRSASLSTEKIACYDLFEHCLASEQALHKQNLGTLFNEALFLKAAHLVREVVRQDRQPHAFTFIGSQLLEAMDNDL